ncbi:M24 family metallopeptidase [Paenibacillus contaminans]|uniref:Xaa-Pro dipeptidase n=1 Tax=Paenibacillus contaminans TaxID=450362 RepID=A0A329MN97_9BACL|nr:Xaa-Pro peptidase family protein [Paenibacillus contaminans]RAV21092.1 Xaa-Pro dipeptidase [Paenibacillus contaminans]
MERRLQGVRKALEQLKLDALFITNSYNRRYLTGFTGSAGYVLITADTAVLLTDFRYTEQAAKQAAAGFQVEQFAGKPIVWVKDQLQKRGITSLGFEQDDVTYATYASYSADLEGIRLVPTDKVVETLRMIKDESEIAVIEQAADLADRTFEHILTIAKPGVSERDLALEIEMFVRRNGASGTSFDTIVASGERSALPHGVASDRKLQANEFMKLDFGALYEGYCSDLTRTVCIGKASDKHKEIHGIVLEAHRNVLAHLKPGMTGVEADSLARDIIAKAGYGDNFGHSLGHGIGLYIHEAPTLSQRSDTVLQPGMVVTVEPGIYLPGFGGVRIENDVVITESGIRVITHSPTELLEIG